MSGNAWEWVSDQYAPYNDAAASDPYVAAAGPSTPQQILRGGRWGGDAREARAASRSGWLRNDRCNNSGFRVARSVRAKER